MSHKDIAFYRGNKQINFDFSAEKISSDGSLLLLEKNERKHKLINYFPKGSSLLDFKPLNEADKLINKEMICAETSHSLRYKNSPSVVPCVAKVDMNNYICNT